MTNRRARALGIDRKGPAALAIGEVLDAAAIFALAADPRARRRLHPVPLGAGADAAIELAKLAHRLPALLIGPQPARDDLPFVNFAAAAVSRFRRAAAESVAIAAEATVPLNGGLSARFIVFREPTGESPVAVVVGKPDFARLWPCVCIPLASPEMYSAHGAAIAVISCVSHYHSCSITAVV